MYASGDEGTVAEQANREIEERRRSLDASSRTRSPAEDLDGLRALFFDGRRALLFIHRNEYGVNLVERPAMRDFWKPTRPGSSATKTGKRR